MMSSLIATARPPYEKKSKKKENNLDHEQNMLEEPLENRHKLESKKWKIYIKEKNEAKEAEQ